MIAAVEARGWFYILGARLRRTKEVRDVVLSDTGAFETVEVARQRPDPMRNLSLDFETLAIAIY